SFTFKQKLTEGTNYFWLTYDIANNAQPGNLIDASLDSVYIGDTMRYPAIKSPNGNRKVENHATYCLPVISVPNSTQNKLIGLTEVKIGNAINNNSADLDDVSFYPAPRIRAYRLQEIPVAIKYGKGLPEQIIGWADWNNDGFLDKATEELFYTSKQMPGETYQATFKIPCHATTGIHKIRLASDYFQSQKPEPCNNLAYGDMEEYLVEVLDDFSPTAGFITDTQAYRSSEAFFTNTSNAAGNIKYEWDYNDDGIYDETALNGSFIFHTNGWKKIRLKLTQTTCNNVRTSIFTDSVNVISPQANAIADFISSSNAPGTGERVFLTDVSSEKPNYWRWEITSTLSDNNATYYFADGTDTNSQNPVVIFNTAGKYTVKLTTANASGKESTEIKKDYIIVAGNIILCNNTDTAREHNGFLYDNGGKISIYTPGQKCFAVIKPPCAESINLTFNTFDVSVYMSATGGDYLRVYDGKDATGIPLHDAAGYKNGFQNLLPGNTPVIPPAVQANSGVIYLEWYSDSAYIGAGFEAKWSTILQNIPKPKALFTSPDTVYELQNIHFSNTSGGNNLKYFWDLDNDGLIDSTTEDANFSFDTAGTYTVILAVSNCGGTDTFRKNITVLTPKAKPIADFSANYVAYREGDIVAFTDLSKNNPYFYNWVVIPNVYSHGYEFVNGTNENSRHPQIKFYNQGLYSIRLEIANSLGTDGHTKANYIEVASQCIPEAKTVSTDVGINSVRLTDISGQDIINQQSASGEKTFTLFSYTNPVLLETGASYTIEIKRLSTFNKIKGNVWIDYNDNGFFNDPGELILKADTITGDTWGGKFTVIGAIHPGISRLRIGVTYAGQSIVTCGNNTIAE
ncbi:MAG: GEVED domain-containing protein, partial [Bacteroidia bacterium]